MFSWESADPYTNDQRKIVVAITIRTKIIERHRLLIFVLQENCVRSFILCETRYRANIKQAMLSNLGFESWNRPGKWLGWTVRHKGSKIDFTMRLHSTSRGIRKPILRSSRTFARKSIEPTCDRAFFNYKVYYAHFFLVSHVFISSTRRKLALCKTPKFSENKVNYNSLPMLNCLHSYQMVI